MNRRRRLLAGLLALAAIAGGIVFWRHAHQPAPSFEKPPEVPPELHDVDIRTALERTRSDVLSSPGSPRAWGELGMVFRAHQLMDQSNVCFEEATRLDPTDPRWTYLIGIRYLESSPDRAIPYLQAAYRAATETAYKSAARLRLAETYLERGDVNEADKLFREETSRDRESLRARFGLAVIATGCDDHRQAIAFLKDAADNPQGHYQVVTLLAASYRQLGDFAAAERLERAARGKTDSPWPDPFLAECAERQTGDIRRRHRAEDLEQLGRWEEALALRDELARVTPDDQNLISLGIALVKLGRSHQAETVLRKVLAHSPDRALARDYLGVALSLQAEDCDRAGDRVGAASRFREALSEFRQSATLNPKVGLPHVHAGLALEKLGRWPDAADEYRAAIRTAPDYAGAHFALGELLLRMNRPAEAVAALETAVRLAPDDRRAQSLLEEARRKK